MSTGALRAVRGPHPSWLRHASATAKRMLWRRRGMRMGEPKLSMKSQPCARQCIGKHAAQRNRRNLAHKCDDAKHAERARIARGLVEPLQCGEARERLRKELEDIGKVEKGEVATEEELEHSHASRGACGSREARPRGT